MSNVMGRIEDELRAVLTRKIISGKGCQVFGRDGGCEFREPAVADAYNSDFDPKNAILSHKSMYF